MVTETNSPAANYTISIWSDACGWESPECTFTREDAWKAVKGCAKVKVFCDNKCVWSRGAEETCYIVHVTIADMEWPVFVHGTKEIADNMFNGYKVGQLIGRGAARMETRRVAPEHYQALLDNVDAAVERIRSADPR